jgi:hypothetical protein
MIISSLVIGRGSRTRHSNKRRIAQLRSRPDRQPGWKGSQGGSRNDTEVNPMLKARMYRLALVAGVVAVFLEGLGASLKWI